MSGRGILIAVVVAVAGGFGAGYATAAHNVRLSARGPVAEDQRGRVQVLEKKLEHWGMRAVKCEYQAASPEERLKMIERLRWPPPPDAGVVTW